MACPHQITNLRFELCYIIFQSVDSIRQEDNSDL
jgi:hypothetical protein